MVWSYDESALCFKVIFQNPDRIFCTGEEKEYFRVLTYEFFVNTMGIILVLERKGRRKSTMKKSEETLKRQKEREAKRTGEKKKKIEYVMPTQEELLEEAKITEKLNLASLGKIMHRIIMPKQT